MNRHETKLADGGLVTLIEGWMSADESTNTFQTLRRNTPWEQKPIKIYGREMMQPRMTAWYGDDNTTYTYSGLVNKPLPWTHALGTLRARLALEGFDCNSVLLNMYRNGQDSIGMHSDDERELGVDPTIFSLSLGATRTFVLQHKTGGAQPIRLPLTSGSLLVMSGTTQKFWKHGVPKEPKVTEPRINLTFRRTN